MAQFSNHIHEYKIAFLDIEDLLILFVVYVLFMFFGIKTLIVTVPLFFIIRNIKNKKPRGSIKHLLYFTGLISIKGYPKSKETNFYE